MRPARPQKGSLGIYPSLAHVYHTDFPIPAAGTVLFCSQPTYKYGGELILGGTDPRLFQGDITWAPVTQELYWQVALEKWVAFVPLATTPLAQLQLCRARGSMHRV